ncbi:hypothetical protein Patl1_30622 [Pistacia atlantica]|uniref:Uncharacterized protein n=1 Tax=Pistacia atlantica TaxID=434234 RepID=A0ACC1ABV0_9ROSI|nr:hypothetical protein Patl1_30622 [Pistacia atlantica]
MVFAATEIGGGLVLGGLLRGNFKSHRLRWEWQRKCNSASMRQIVETVIFHSPISAFHVFVKKPQPMMAAVAVKMRSGR